MRSLLALPTSILTLLLYAAPAASTAAEERPWPYNLPRHMKYFPEDEAHMKRGVQVYERLLREKPVGVKKMSTDEGEMFMLDNWIFASDIEAEKRDIVPEKRAEDWIEERSMAEGNATVLLAFSPLRPHSEFSVAESQLRFMLRNILMGRGFQCPSGTKSCSGIGQPDSCCGTTDTCINIPDNGFGTVGCCPQGQSCSGAINCDMKAGYTSCPGSSNGGCCLPGYTCQGVGCVVAGTSITYIQPSTSAAPPSSSTAVVVVPTTPSPSPTPSSSPSPSASPSASSTCSSGWFSCAASLGGGCCQNGLTCASGAACLGASSAASSMAPSAPVRPTSVITTPQSPSTLPGDGMCPTGFYVCSAYYPTGCCRIGRDCQTTGTCVPTSSGVIVNSNGVTIAAPSGAFATTAPGQRGSCASGWYSCAASRGGNCCPNGYECAEQCTATASGVTGVSGKIAPSSASAFSHGQILAFVTTALGIGCVMILL